MKEYGELLKHDPQYAEPARRFSALTADITEFLAGLPLDPPQGRVNVALPTRTHATWPTPSASRASPATCLKSIPGLELVEMEASSMCLRRRGVLLHGAAGAGR